VRILVLSPYLPHKNVGHGGGTAVRGLVKYLGQKHNVLLASLLRPGEQKCISDVEQLGIQVAPIPFTDTTSRGNQRASLLISRTSAACRAVASSFPYFVTKYWSRQISARVLDIARGFDPDAIQIEYLQLALLCRDLRQWRDERADKQESGKPFLALNSHELGSLPRLRRAKQTTNPLRRLLLTREAAAWDRLQVAASQWADTTLCVTEQDRQLFAKLGGQNLLTVPLGVDTDLIKADWHPVDPPFFLFVGSFAHGPNRSAVKFLVDKIWPEVAKYSTDGKLVLAGRGSRAFIKALGLSNNDAQNRICALGFVDDLTSLFRECRLFVAPLTEGGGIKIKILEAMGRGVPIITTPIGAEGIVSTTDDAVWLSEPDLSFAGKMIEALNDPESATRKTRNASRIIANRFSWTAITDRLVQIYQTGC